MNVQKSHKDPEGTQMMKVRIKADMSQDVGDQSFFFQDMFMEMVEGAKGEIRTTPAPPRYKERKIKQLLTDKRKAMARRRKRSHQGAGPVPRSATGRQWT